MNEQNFHSDVGQVAGGSIVNTTSGPMQSNVITIHGAALSEPPVPITELQRKAIGAKVAQVAEQGGVEMIHVYRIILTQFGVNRIRELPKADYLATMSLLEELEKSGGDSPTTPDSIESEAEPLAACPDPQAIHNHSAACHGYVALCGELSRMERRVRTTRLWAGAMVSALFAGVLAVLAAFYTSTIEAKGRYSKQVCHFGSGVYSVGSVLTVTGSKSRECLPDPDRMSAHWEPINTSSGRR